MVDPDEKKLKKEEVVNIPLSEQSSRAPLEGKEVHERSEPLPSDDIKKIRATLEAADLDNSLKPQAQSQANDLAALAEEKKIKKLLELAQSKGAVYAVQVAKKMNDPYVLDKLHDALVEAGIYKLKS